MAGEGEEDEEGVCALVSGQKRGSCLVDRSTLFISHAVGLFAFYVG